MPDWGNDPEIAAQAEAWAEQGQKTILVADDTRENLTVIGELLQPYYRVRVANSGQRALKAAHTEPRPDLILLDVMMPEMDGFAVLAELRKDPATRDIPVIFVTAMDADQDEEKGLKTLPWRMHCLPSIP